MAHVPLQRQALFGSAYELRPRRLQARGHTVQLDGDRGQLADRGPPIDAVIEDPAAVDAVITAVCGEPRPSTVEVAWNVAVVCQAGTTCTQR